MTPKALQKAALSFPETHEEPHFHRTSFRVGKKIFATMVPNGREAMVRVPDPDQVHALLASYPDTFFSYGTWTVKNGALGVRLAKAKAEMMHALLLGAWRSIAPKRTIDRFDANKKPG
jgi:hypothetical protein